MMENLIKVSTAASKLDYHPDSLRRLIRAGRFEEAVVRIGRSIRLREDFVTQYMKTGGKPETQETVTNG